MRFCPSGRQSITLQEIARLNKRNHKGTIPLHKELYMSISHKALSAFKKLGSTGLITAAFLVLLFTGCPNANGSKPVTPKYKITFSVDGSNGNLTAAVDGKTITSGTEVEKDKKVTFTATPNAGYKIKGWTLDGNAVNGTDNSYQLKIEKAVTVTVSFEAIPPTKYTVTLNQTEHGKVTTSPEIPADGKVDENTVITFTAEAEAGYRVNTWSVSPSSAIKSGGGKGDATATVKITADTTVSVSFELGKVIFTLDAGKPNIIVKAKTKDGSDIQVEGCDETILKSDKAAELHAKGTIVTLKGKISELICHNNQLVALNVQGCTSLQKLLCHNNQLVVLNVQDCTALEKLLCRKNKLTSLNVQGCTALKDIQCQANQLTGLDIQGLTALEKLFCNSNQLTSLNVQGCTALKDIQCQANQLNADVFKKLFIDLPVCKSSDDAEAILYTEETDANEGNHKDFTNPPELKTAFDDAKSKNWALMKKKPDETEEDI